MGRGYGWMYGPPGWGRGWGRGWGHGWGRGWGPGWGYAAGPEYGAGPVYAAGPEYGAGPYAAGTWGAAPTAAPTVEDEAAFLKEEAQSVRTYLEGIERRISELEKTSE